MAAWLAAQGWSVLEHRWRCPAGEIDLVCRAPAGLLVGVEVKLRSTGRTGTGAESIDARRLARLRAALATYARLASPSAGLRVDLVTVTPEADGRWRVRRLPAIDGW